MPPSKEKKVTEPQALVLYIIWRAKQRVGTRKGQLPLPPTMQTEGLTNVQVQAALQHEYEKLKRARGASLGNIKKIIDTLTEWQPTPLLDAAAREGNEATVYRLAKNMVRWSTTASMLIHLETDTQGPITRQDFVREIVNREMKNPDETAFSKAHIENALDFCENTVPPYVTENKNGFIVTTDRVHSEERFLYLIRHS